MTDPVADSGESRRGIPDLSRIVKAYDIRGRAFDDFTEDAARAFGAAFADLLDAGDLVVSHDMRVSSPALAGAFAEGAVRRGATVAFAGLSSTDQLYCASGLFKAAGAQVTASHNPAPDNGIKMCFPGARPVGRDSGLLEVRDGAQAYLEAGDIPEREGGRYEEVDTLDDYVSLMLDLVSVPDTRPLTVVVDAANAMAGHTVPALAERLTSVTIVPLYFELDGTFPNHEANPLDYSTLADLQAAVREHGADMGLAFDGDADRCIVIDERGEVVNPSAITALIATNEIRRAAAEGEQVPAVVANAVSSRAVTETIESEGGRHVRSRVGHSIIKSLMAQENAVFGGEHSAHYYFRDFFFADSGMLAALHVLRALADTAEPLSSLVAKYVPYYSSGEINSRVSSVEEPSAAVVGHFQNSTDVEIDQLDGYTITHWNEEVPEVDRWWVSLRPSNTEPLLRLNVEASSEDTMARVRDEVLAVIRGDAEPIADSGHGAATRESGANTGADSNTGAEVPDWVRAVLRCPRCKGSIVIDFDDARCRSCTTRYDVSDSIPLLIHEA